MPKDNKDLRKLLRFAQEHGCEVEMGRGGHWKLRRGGRMITVSASASCPHALANVKADMRRYLNMQV